MMKDRALAVEASSDRLGIAVCHEGRMEVRELQPARAASQQLFQHAGALLDAVGSGFDQLEWIAFGRGPGSFTGVRIAAAAVQAIALAADLPVCRVSSLAVMAAGALRRQVPGDVAVCVDARMGRAYFGQYRADSDGGVLEVAADLLIAPGSFVVPGEGSFLAIGNAWAAYPDLLQRHRTRVVATDADLLPDVRDLLVLAARDYACGRAVAAPDALPEYLAPGPATVR